MAYGIRMTKAPAEVATPFSPKSEKHRVAVSDYRCQRTQDQENPAAHGQGDPGSNTLSGYHL